MEMLISGFTYIRNGFTYDYPFLESIQSILSICDELVVAVGDSTDGTREAIVNLGSDKVRIVDTVWDENLREGGQIFAQQANAALDAITGRWGFHLQADEIVHENDLEKIRQTIQKHDNDEKVEGFLFRFLNFWGGYHHIGISRRWHRYEVRVIRNTGSIRSYRDSQGFRKYANLEEFHLNHRGQKLGVREIDVPIYHYSYTRPPELMKKKADYFHRFWHDDNWLQDNINDNEDVYAVNADELNLFEGNHPAVMQSIVEKQDWDIDLKKMGARLSFKERLLLKVEKYTGWRIGEYKNYRRI